MSKHLYWVLIFGLFITACGHRTVYSEHHALPESGWTYADSLNFSVEIVDTLRLYDLIIDLVHQKDYPFQNLYTRIHTTFPDGKRLTQVLSLELAGKTGKWEGRCSGSRCRLSLPIQKKAYFNQSGNYAFTIEQYMRVDSLKGIQSLGLRVTDQGERPLSK